MARLFSSGFELNSITNGVEWQAIGGSPTISTSTVRTGTYAARISSMSSATRMGFLSQFNSAAGAGPFWLRSYFNFATLPSAENTIMMFSDGSNATTANNRYRITIDSSGLLRLYNASTQIGSASSALSTGTWYRIEMKLNGTGAGGTHILEGRIDGTNFASSSSLTLGFTVFSIELGGNINTEAQTQGDWFIDDVAVNDSTGSFQTAYPGSGKILHLKPNATGDANGFTVQVGGTAGSTNNFTRVNEVPPNNATSYNGSALLNAEDLFNCDDSGVGASDTVNVVALGVRLADLVSADATTGIKLEIEKTTGGTKSQSANIVPNSTTFVTNASAAPRNSPLTLYQDPDSSNWSQTTLDSMQIGYILDALGVQTVAVSTVWASVDYTPVGVSPSASLSPSASISPSASVSPSSSISASTSPSSSLSPSSSISASISPSSSASPSASRSPSSSISASISPSASTSPSSSASASLSPSASTSPSSSLSPSSSVSASVSPSSSISASRSPSSSTSPSASISASLSPSTSVSLSISPSSSVSPSSSRSASRSPSASTSPSSSISSSLSPSASPSPSASISPSPSPAFIPPINAVTAIKQSNEIIVTKASDIDLVVLD